LRDAKNFGSGELASRPQARRPAAMARRLRIQWERALESALEECVRSPAELASALKSAHWKRALARKLRDAAHPNRWLAEKLGMGKPGSVRAYLHAAGPEGAGRE